MQSKGQTLLGLLAIGLLGCGPESMVEPLEPVGPLTTPPPPPGVVYPGGVLPPPPPEFPPGAPPSSGSPGGSEGGPPPAAPAPSAPVVQPPAVDPGPLPRPEMTFFVTSRGSRRGGGDFRARTRDEDGLAGADALCEELAAAALPELSRKTWRAYLSTALVNARDRIGTGPWRNAKGTVIAETLDQLHEQGELRNNFVGASSMNVLDERGKPLDPDLHDVLTGTGPDGNVDPQGRTCGNWRSLSAVAQALVGHGDRRAVGSSSTGRSWNASHGVDCGPLPTTGRTNRVDGTVSASGGQGSIYCFAAGE
jgi:hypothetical protein